MLGDKYEYKYEVIPRGRLSQHVPQRWISAATALKGYLAYNTDLITFFAKISRQLFVTNKLEVTTVSLSLTSQRYFSLVGNRLVSWHGWLLACMQSVDGLGPLLIWDVPRVPIP